MILSWKDMTLTDDCSFSESLAYPLFKTTESGVIDFFEPSISGSVTISLTNDWIDRHLAKL